MHIRTATVADFAELCRIDSVALSNPARQDEIAHWLKAAVCHLVEIDSQVAAYGVLTNHFFGQPFIDMLMVGSQFRRQGAGMALLLNFRANCPGPKLFSSTNMSNTSMQNLLIKAGFIPSGYIENLDENDPEIVFYSPVPL